MKSPCICGFTAIVLTLLAGLAVVPRALAADVAQAVLDAEQQRIAAIEKASKSAVAIFANGGRGGGSGVVITPDGYALTNFHVVQPAGDYMQCGMNDGRLYDAVIVGIDPTGDVALIKLLGRDDFTPATMADSDGVRVGDWCFAVGNPFLLATNFQPTVTFGIVSGVHRYQEPAGTLLEYADCIQTDASINPGNSGGPLFNANGDLIGINGRGSFEKRGRVNVGVGYAISINQIKHFLGYLHSGRIVDHATLGATVSTSDDNRVIVSDILESSDAYRRGLRYGDQIVAFGGRTVDTANEFKNVLGIFPRGWRVPMTYRRDDQQFDVLVRLTGVHAREELLEKVQRAVPAEEPPGGKKPDKDDESKEDDQPRDDEKNSDADKPDGSQPKPGQPKPGQPRPARRSPAAQQVKVPEAAAKLIEQRRGYANYYFNQLNRDRVWKSFGSSAGEFSTATGPWKLTGELTIGGDVEILLGDETATALFPGGPANLELSKDLDEQTAPEGSGGLLVGLHLWQRMLRVGPAQFGDVYYLGTVPVPGKELPCDTLVGSYNVVESRFMFDPETGLLASVEMYASPDGDPCEIYFSDYREMEGRQWPHRMEVRHGNDVFADVQWKKIEVAPAVPAKPADAS
ncbi:MAG: trypsin-like peptidase domain-containing protein [Planctomycetales bacterium]|nr:trypsin-like peptidase domain-containing protein [Planctomycetales bacterium]